jgi:hypothetical protein
VKNLPSKRDAESASYIYRSIFVVDLVTMFRGGWYEGHVLDFRLRTGPVN